MDDRCYSVFECVGLGLAGFLGRHKTPSWNRGRCMDQQSRHDDYESIAVGLNGTFKEVLQEILTNRGLTWQQLSKRIGRDRAMWSKYDNPGYDRPRFASRDTLRDTCITLDMSPSEVVTTLLAWSGLQNFVKRRMNDDDRTYGSTTIVIDLDANTAIVEESP